MNILEAHSRGGEKDLNTKQHQRRCHFVFRVCGMAKKDAEYETHPCWCGFRVQQVVGHQKENRP